MERRELFSIQDMVLIGLFVSVITICSFVRIPFGTIPFTLQTLGVFVAAALLGTKRGLATIIVYILMGIIGAPVFGGAGGLAVITGSTGGYITGFVFSVIIIGAISGRVKKCKPVTRYVVNALAMLLGDIVCMIFGTVQFMLLTNADFAVAMGYCVVPFIIPDIVKIVVAVGLVETMRKADKRLFIQ